MSALLPSSPGGYVVSALSRVFVRASGDVPHCHDTVASHVVDALAQTIDCELPYDSAFPVVTEFADAAAGAAIERASAATNAARIRVDTSPPARFRTNAFERNRALTQSHEK